MIARQAKGLQHCRDIKQDALTYWYLYGGSIRDMKICIGLALEDHVKLLQEEVEMMRCAKVKEELAPSVESGESTPYLE
jgi:hypothetical protein